MNKLNSEQMARLSEIAAYLQQKRLELSFSLEYIQQRTQIRVSLLQAIEEGKFEILPEPVYIKGFIRLYGNAIGVDGDALAHNFIQASQASNVQTAATQTALAEPIPVNTFTPYFTLPDRLSERLRLRYSVPYLVLLVFATSILSWLVRQPTENKQVQTQTPSESELESEVQEKPSSSAKITQETPQTGNSTQLPEAQIPTGETANSRTTANLSTTLRQEKENSPQAVEEVESSPQVNPSPSSSATSPEEKPRDNSVTSTPTQSTTARSPQPLSVKMQLEGGDSWLRVTVDGEAIYEGVLQDGEEKTWDAQGEIKIRSGNAGVVKLSTNQGQSQAMGNPGEVKDITINSDTSQGTVGN